MLINSKPKQLSWIKVSNFLSGQEPCNCMESMMGPHLQGFYKVNGVVCDYIVEESFLQKQVEKEVFNNQFNKKVQDATKVV